MVFRKKMLSRKNFVNIWHKVIALMDFRMKNESSSANQIVSENLELLLCSNYTISVSLLRIFPNHMESIIKHPLHNMTGFVNMITGVT